MRLEGGFALLATLFANKNRKQGSEAFSMHDFAPHHDEPVITLDDAMKKWG